MPLLRLDKVSLAYGLRPLLRDANLEVFRGERVCLIGRNGEGKSSLLRLVSAEIQPDEGVVWVRPGIKVARLAQEVALDSPESVFDVVAGGLPRVGALLVRYHDVAQRVAATHAAADLKHLSELQQELEALDGWRIEQRVETVLSRLSLDGAAPIQSLSGGWRRRALLARALVSEPDLLLLDEPTNHLDVEAITWLEETLLEWPNALLFVSHDRAFVRRLATRIIELDRGALTSWPGNYDEYVERKAQQLEVEAQHNALFDKKLAQEEVWIRKGVEARRTRNEGRVRALYALREERRRRLDRSGPAQLQLQDTESSGKLVFEAEHVTQRFGDKVVIRDFSVRIMRGDRIGIIGPNGAGKSTLIKLLLGELEAAEGRVRQGTRLQVAYYDQQREQLDPTRTVMENVSGTSETVIINGQPRHVSGYLRDFLFAPERLHSPVSMLSGGERNRLLLARLFAQPANLLVLDEPTNDLDVETLELLEQLVADFPGTLLLVSHDRAFLDNVVTGTLVFEGSGHVREYVGGYTDWLRQRRPTPSASTRPLASAATRVPDKTETAPAKPRKRSFKDQRELEQLPGRIEGLEAEVEQLQSQLNDPAIHKKPRSEFAATLTKLETVSAELERCYARWQELEAP
ncbi:MAG TPA: ATP-binding cassette domain-containing protein [Steroidobacteraceae bacterium]|nr:ATP-binding cassette domain-containing protein [Steroidobacteraceae bacterium]